MNDFDKSAVVFAAVVAGGWALAVATEAAAGWLDGVRARRRERSLAEVDRPERPDERAARDAAWAAWERDHGLGDGRRQAQ